MRCHAVCTGQYCPASRAASLSSRQVARVLRGQVVADPEEADARHWPGKERSSFCLGREQIRAGRLDDSLQELLKEMAAEVLLRSVRHLNLHGSGALHSGRARGASPSFAEVRASAGRTEPQNLCLL